MSDDLSIPLPGHYDQRHRVSEPPPSSFSIVRIALAIGAVVITGAIAASVVHFHSGPPPVIEADTRPIKERPKDPGGMQIAGANNDILSGGNDTGGSKLAPPPETPNPQALHAETPVPPPAPVARPVPAPAAQAAVTVTPPAAPKAMPAVPAAAPAPAHTAPHGRAAIQLAALKTEADARAEWSRLAKRFPDVLAGHAPAISKTERGGTTYWRLRTAGFGDVAQAKAACEKVRAKGSSCSVADF